MEFQTYLKNCDCSNGGILFKDNVACCRWCRQPYTKGGFIFYEKEHFEKHRTTHKQIPELSNFKILSYSDKGVIQTDPEQYCPKNPDHNIFNVERKYDSKIFHVGQITNYGIIENFYIRRGGLSVTFGDGSGATFESIQPIPERGAHLFSVEQIKFISRLIKNELNSTKQ